MKTILTVLATIAVVNVGLFLINKFFSVIGRRILKLIYKNDFSAIFNDPDIKESSKIRNRYIHWFWSIWIVFYYSIASLTGVHFYLALCGGMMLYFIGSSEERALAKHSMARKERIYKEEQDKIEQFFAEVANRIQTLQIDYIPPKKQGKKDDERN